MFNLDVFVRAATFSLSRVDIETIRKVVSFQKVFVILLNYQVSPAVNEIKHVTKVLAIIPIGTCVSKSMA